MEGSKKVISLHSPPSPTHPDPVNALALLSIMFPDSLQASPVHLLCARLIAKSFTCTVSVSLPVNPMHPTAVTVLRLRALPRDTQQCRWGRRWDSGRSDGKTSASRLGRRSAFL